MSILYLFFGLLKSLTFVTLMRSLLHVLCTHIIISSFLIRLTPPLLLIAKYTHIILEMLITSDLISVEQTLNSSQSSIQDLNYGTPFPIILRNWQVTLVSRLHLKKIPHRESYKLNSPDHDMAADIIS